MDAYQRRADLVAVRRDCPFIMDCNYDEGCDCYAQAVDEIDEERDENASEHTT